MTAEAGGQNKRKESPAEQEKYVRFFERDQDYEVIERKLPHWTQPGTLAFITFRTFDSLPRHVIESWKKEQHRLLRQQGIDPHSRDVDIQFKALPWLAQMEINNSLADRWHNDLDSCYGACVLKRQDLAKIVSGSLHKFENDRYELSDFVVMPNHVHLLAAFRNETDMLGQCRSWKHYTAVEINRYLKLKGQRFWQQDGFDPQRQLIGRDDFRERLRQPNDAVNLRRFGVADENRVLLEMLDQIELAQYCCRFWHY